MKAPAFVLVLALALAPGTAFATEAADQALARLASAWQDVHTYRCTITEHEEKGSRVQDRVYSFVFARPHEVRMEIVQGDGKGGVAVWHGGSRVVGHRGGFLSFLNLNLDIHNPLATTVRGTTIAQADFGAVLHHLQQLDKSSFEVSTHDGDTTLVAVPADPAADHGVTREILVLGPDHLPISYTQLVGARPVRRVGYSDVQLNVTLPADAFTP